MIHVIPPRQRGALWPIVTEREAGCGGRRQRRARFFVRTNGADADGEVVWSWRPDAGAKSRGYDPRGDGGKKARFPRESTKDPVKTAAQGRPDVRPILW